MDTIDDVAIALGLELPDDFAQKILKRNRENAVANELRGTGRTVRMLLHATLSLVNGDKIRIMAHNYGYAKDLTWMVREWGRKLGCDPSLIMTPTVNPLWGTDAKVHRDHYFGDGVWFVYLLECADSTYYIGISTDVGARLKLHNSGRGAKYTRGRLPVVLLYTVPVGSLSDAASMERKLKKMNREAKLKWFRSLSKSY